MIAVFIKIFSWIIKFWLDGDEDLEHNLVLRFVLCNGQDYKE
jgi:hypothetical protein